MYKSGSETCLRPRQPPQHSLSLGVPCLVWIILKTEEKLLAVARKEVGRALKEAFDIRKPPCADAAVIQILTEKTEAASRVSESLSEKVEAECLEECLRFLESYENEVRSFLQLDGCPGICSSLRILENCCILRIVWHKLTHICSASTGQDVKVNGFLDRMEDDITEHFLQTVTSKVKGTLKEHFRRCDSGFDHILESLKQSFLAFVKKKTDTYEALVKAVNVIIITEYVQVLLTTSRKPSSVQRKRIVSKIEEDHRMLQTIFKECLACCEKHEVSLPRGSICNRSSLKASGTHAAGCTEKPDSYGRHNSRTFAGEPRGPNPNLLCKVQAEDEWDMAERHSFNVS
ncbi:uncharacterized protein [Ciconia boyciana]|uniref:uncharacterized protein n=1 Tax=Ciconia boyciana TaxID=52775 RepID=UPI003BA0F7C7